MDGFRREQGKQLKEKTVRILFSVMFIGFILVVSAGQSFASLANTSASLDWSQLEHFRELELGIEIDHIPMQRYRTALAKPEPFQTRNRVGFFVEHCNNIECRRARHQRYAAITFCGIVFKSCRYRLEHQFRKFRS